MRKEAVGSAGIPAGVSSSNQVGNHGANAAAFFDLDGTLLPMPPLERRVWRLLLHRNRIGVGNYLAWLKEALRLLPKGIAHVVNGNKAYLRGVRVADLDALRIPQFFPPALDRVKWHAQHGHRIVLVSGTLEPLALRVARLMETELAARGMRTRVAVCGTQLESTAGIWTGRIVGEAMFGEAKARAVGRFCAAEGMAPAHCFAYGDSANDRWMLEAVGRPIAVNPADDLARIARRNGWPVTRWTATEVATQSSQGWHKSANSEIGGQEVPVVAAAERECCG